MSAAVSRTQVLALRADAQEIYSVLRLLTTPGQVIELRALKATEQGRSWRFTASGYFDQLEALAREAASLSGRAESVYVTLNPVDPALLARAANRVKQCRDDDPLTGDKDVTSRAWLLLDFDYDRAKGISTTDAEHAAALMRAREVCDWLAGRGWPPPILADSGNGAHLLYRIALLNDDSARDLLQHCLEALAWIFNDRVKVDTSVFNASRLVKLYGTLAAKGDSTPERPHRLARVLDTPDELVIVDPAMLQALAAELPTIKEPDRPKENGASHLEPYDVDRFIRETGLQVAREGAWRDGRRWVLRVCPFNPEHRDRSAYILQFRNGAVAAGCHHNSCQGNGWRQLRALDEATRGASHRAVAAGSNRNGSSVAAAENRPRAAASACVMRLADVQPEQVLWLWPGRIPLGKLSLWEGDPGLGKSVASLDIAARISNGLSMPDGTIGDLRGPAGALLLTAEDGLSDTVRPRLDAAGADVSRIAALTLVIEESGERLPTLADLRSIEDAIAAVGAKLVIVDPLMAYLPGDVNSFRDQDVRRLLAPLAQLAERSGAAVLVIRHLTKGQGGNPLYRGGGSIGIIGAARSCMLVAPDPDDPSGARRIVAVTKSNLAITPSALAYHLLTAENGAPRVVWEGPTNHTASSLLAVPTDPEGRDALTEAQEFLRDLLADGSVPAKTVKEQARYAGIAEATLNRAKRAIRIRPRKEGFEGKDSRWVWELPAEDDQDSEDAHTYTPDHLRQDDHLRPQAGALNALTGGRNSVSDVPGTDTRRKSLLEVAHAVFEDDAA